MEPTGLLVSITVALAATVALTVLVNAVRVSRIRLKPMRSEDIDVARVPAEARSILDVGRPWLLARGFRYVGSSRIRPMIAHASEWKYADKYLRDADGTFALVSAREQPRPGDSTAIEFQSVFADGTMMVTVDRFRHAMVWEPAGWTFDDDYLGDFQRALENHVARVRARGEAPLPDIELHHRVSDEMIRGYVDGTIRAGLLERSPAGEIRFRFMPAVRYVTKVLRGNMRDGKVKVVPLGEVRAAAPAMQGVASEVAADLQAYQTRRAAVASATRAGKWKLGLLSAVGFVVLGGVVWDWSTAAILLGVIAFHEGGHYAAMKVVGYRNLNVFFLPGLGGLATGEKQDASAAQKVFVYLAGPMPGLMLATFGLLWLPIEGAAPPWLREALVIMLIVNGINLLPVIPLDGGRVLEVLLFMRWPRLRVVFALGSSAALILAGAAFGDTVLLAIGVLVGVALPAQWRFAKLARRVKRKPGEGLDEPSAARRVFETLADASFRKWSFQTRAAAADELISELRTPIPGLIGTGAGLALYAACLMAPLVAAVVASPLFRETAQLVWDANHRDDRFMTREAAGRATRSPEHDLRRVANSLPPGDVERVRAMRLFVAEEPDPDRRAPALRALLEELQDASPAAEPERARLRIALAFTLDSTPERLQLLVAGRNTLAEADPADPLLAAAWSELARERAARGDSAGAEREWQALNAWEAGRNGERP